MDTSAETAAAPAPKHEYLTVAAGATLAEACTYLRDLGVRILDHEARNGRWVIKAMAQQVAQ